MTAFAFAPAADAVVEQKSPNRNLGRASYLRTDRGGDPGAQSYLRFNVSRLSGSVVRAVLRVHAQRDGTVDGPALYAAGSGWTESGITWNTRPARAAVATADSGRIAASTWVEFNVTSRVRGEGTYDFALATGSSDGVNFDSRETSRPPKLLVTTSGVSVDSQAPTSPSGLSVAATRSGLALSWMPATDNVAVTGYDVYLDRSKVGATAANGYTFSNLACGTGYTLTVQAYDGAGNRSAASSLDARTSSCGDTSPPSVPGSVVERGATVDSIALAWTPSVDDVGVAGYSLYVNGVPAGTSTSPSYSFGRLACGTGYTLAVDAYDAAGNHSPRASVIASTSRCPSSTTLTFAPAADAAVEQESPNSTLGRTSYLRTDGGADPAVESYLRFNVSGVGGTVQKAVLRLHAQGDPTVDGPAVYAAGDGWTESAINWNTQPAHATTAAADSGAIAASSWVEFDVTRLVQGAGTYNFELATTSSDGVNFDSRETSNAPLLVVTTSGSTVTGSGIDTQAPTVPSGLSLGGATATNLSLGWSASVDNVGVAGYDLYLNGAKVGTTTASAYSFPGLTCGTRYTLAVDAYDAAGNRSQPASLQASTSACTDTSAPTAPASLIQTASTRGSITLSWGASLDNVGVAGYTLYLNGTKVATTTLTNYGFVNLSCGTSYTLAVDAYDAAGNRSAAPSVQASTSACADGSPPTTPGSPAARSSTSNTIVLSWAASGDNVGVAGYGLYLNGTQAGTTVLTTYTFSNLTCGTSYTLGVEAYDAAGNRSSRASLTAATSACPVSTPTGPAPPPAPGSWTLKFDDEFNASSLDLAKWRPNWLGPSDTAVTKPVNSAELSCYDPAQVSEGNGVVTLSAVQSSCTATNGVTYAYRSGLIESYNHYQFTYGYMEARMYLPTNSSGTPVNWPGFWADGTGSWPTTGEIDVLEVLGGGTPCWHFHWTGGGPGGCPSLSQMGATQYGGWHTFGADWEPGEIDFYYDGHKVGCVNNGGTNGCLLAGVTTSPMYVIANLGISALHGGPLVVPSTVDLDYVRVWQH